MNSAMELHLALILFLAWFAILGVLFWCYPRQPRDTARRVFDEEGRVLAIDSDGTLRDSISVR